MLVLRSPSARARLARARRWLVERSSAEPVLILAATAEAAGDLVWRAAGERGAAFGWHRATVNRLAGELAGPRLSERGLAPVGPLVVEAVLTRVVHVLGAAGELGRYAAVVDGPGLPRALALSLAEADLAGVAGDALGRVSPDLARLRAAYRDALAEAGLADRAEVLRIATEIAEDPDSRAPWLDLALVVIDLPLGCTLEARLVHALAARATSVCVTLPAGDERSAAAWSGAVIEDLRDDLAPVGLGRLQEALFAEISPGATRGGRRIAPVGLRDGPEGSHPVLPLPSVPEESVARSAGVDLLSAPGESRECIEIARRILDLAAAGTPFDRMAVLLRSPEDYRLHLSAALARARVPAWFDRGVVLPHPAGRAFLALLRTATEGLSARRFAEYLSLGELPAASVPPPAAPPTERWVAPDEELLPRGAVDAIAAAADAGVGADTSSADGLGGGSAAEPGAEPRVAEPLRAPRRWERLLVEAAVIGGLARWRRRLEGLAQTYRLELEAAEDPEEPAAARARQALDDLARLSEFALPLLEELDALPERAAWGVWLDRLSALATRALRSPERVLAKLAELAPLAPVGPVDLGEVCRVLSRHLLELAAPPPPARFGRVFVAPVDAARGLEFDVVFVPGLAEALFPRKIVEDPILLDTARRRASPALATNTDRVAAERLALRLAAGAAARQLVLSWPRLDLEQARPRVPSFYALEAVGAAEGRLPRLDELARRAERVGASRLGWPAPERPERAVDEAEYDLAVLTALLDRDATRAAGAARYLLSANPHLARALRQRARRWLHRWTPCDGLVDPSEAARQALAAHQIDRRSFSPTALQNYAQCPYRFFLYAVHRLAPRDEVAAIEELDALQRGSLVHDTQFTLLSRLREQARLPVGPGGLDEALATLDEVLDAVAAQFRDDLAPAIDRVWDDGIAAVRADLREWLRRAAVDDSGFVPWRFELSFGLVERRARDPHSVAEAVPVEGGLQLRGSIDLLERDASGALRVTDHKTGRAWVESGSRIAGGTALQPVLYALVAERLFGETRVVAGRLYYCTSAGGFQTVEVPLDDDARAAARSVAGTVGAALAEGFLPAAPARGACRFCDYLDVCGPDEERRVGRKPAARLAALVALRAIP